MLLLRELLRKKPLDALRGGTYLLAGKLDVEENTRSNHKAKNQNVVEVGEHIVDSEDSDCPKDSPSKKLLDGLHWFTFRRGCLALCFYSTIGEMKNANYF